MNGKLTDRNVLDDVLLTFLDGPITPSPYDLSGFLGSNIFRQRQCWSDLVLACEYEFLAVYGLGLRAQMSQWAWITGLQSLSLISVSNNGLLTSHVRHQAPGIPSSCSPIWIFMLHCQLPFSQTSQLFLVFTIHQRSEHWGGRKWSGPRLRHDWDPDLVTLSALSSRRSEGSNLMRPLRSFNQGEYSNLELDRGAEH